jgi:hypothetical protein
MELFLPSLLAIVAMAIFAFAVIPQFGPLSLGVVSLLALIGAGVHHYLMFKDEYANSTWQNTIRQYSGYITLGVAIIICILFLVQMRSSLFSSAPAAANATNAAKNAALGTDIVGAVNSAVASLTGPPPPTPSAAPPTILDTATDAAVKSLNAMREGAQQISNPIVAAVNRGLNAVIPSGPAPTAGPPAAAKPITPLPFSPSEV